MTPDEVNAWKVSIRALGAEPFVTKGCDIESYFVDSEHLAELNGNFPKEEVEILINNVLDAMRSDLVAAYVNGRTELERKAGTFGSLDLGKLAVEASNAVSANPRPFAGKKALRAIRSAFAEHHGLSLRTKRLTPHLLDEELHAISKKLAKTSKDNK
jgi:hypothetical protein